MTQIEQWRTENEKMKKKLKKSKNKKYPLKKRRWWSWRKWKSLKIDWKKKEMVEEEIKVVPAAEAEHGERVEEEED